MQRAQLQAAAVYTIIFQSLASTWSLWQEVEPGSSLTLFLYGIGPLKPPVTGLGALTTLWVEYLLHWMGTQNEPVCLAAIDRNCPNVVLVSAHNCGDGSTLLTVPWKLTERLWPLSRCFNGAHQLSNRQSWLLHLDQFESIPPTLRWIALHSPMPVVLGLCDRTSAELIPLCTGLF